MNRNQNCNGSVRMPGISPQGAQRPGCGPAMSQACPPPKANCGMSAQPQPCASMKPGCQTGAPQPQPCPPQTPGFRPGTPQQCPPPKPGCRPEMPQQCPPSGPGCRPEIPQPCSAPGYGQPLTPCYDTGWNYQKYPVGMGYVPMQNWEIPYPMEQSFSRGTIFQSLDDPFLMGRCRR